MNLQDWGAIGEVVGALAVVVTVIVMGGLQWLRLWNQS